MKIYERIKNRRKELGLTADQVAGALGVSRATIYRYESAQIEKVPTDALAPLAKVLKCTPAYLMGWSDSVVQTSDTASAPPLRIPVLGRVAAGIPIDMVEDIVDWEELPADMARHGEYFGLVIHGDSMEPKMSEGDVIIVRQQADIESGQIGIVTVNGDDAACKRIMKYADGIMLLSTNPKYPPMQYTSKEMKDLPIRILGKVVELRAKFE